MELNPGYALITTDEYKDLIETSIYYEEILLLVSVFNVGFAYDLNRFTCRSCAFANGT